MLKELDQIRLWWCDKLTITLQHFLIFMSSFLGGDKHLTWLLRKSKFVNTLRNLSCYFHIRWPSSSTFLFYFEKLGRFGLSLWTLKSNCPKGNFLYVTGSWAVTAIWLLEVLVKCKLGFMQLVFSVQIIFLKRTSCIPWHVLSHPITRVVSPIMYSYPKGVFCSSNVFYIYNHC